jgi:SSS family solute:Na+ symporter/sodium/proline symporter
VIGWIAGTIVVESMIVAVGLLGSVTIPGLDTAESETIVVRTAVSVLPTLLGMLLLAGSAAIIVSTASSMLLTPATNLVRDVYQRVLNPAATDSQIVLYTRIAVAALAAVGVIAGGLFPTILAMALWAYTMYGAGITPALLAAFVWPRATRDAAVYSIAAGMLVTLIWETIALARGSALFGLQTIYPAVFASTATLIGITLVKSEPTAPT